MQRPTKHRIKKFPFRPACLLAIGALLSLAVMNLSFLKSARAQIAASSAQEKTSGPLTVTANFSEAQSVKPDTAIALQLSRAMEKSDGRLAIFINALDVTSLFKASETRLIYQAQILPLSPGDSVVTVYRIAARDEWQEVAHFPLKVVNEITVTSASSPTPNTDASPSVPDKQNGEATAAAKPEASPAQSSEKNVAPPASQETGKADEPKPIQAEAATAGTKAETETNKVQEKSATTEPVPTASADSQPAQETGAQPQATEAAAEPSPKKRFGFEKLDFIPSISLTIKSQPAQSSFPADNAPARPTFTDLNTTSSYRTEMLRGRFAAQTQFDFAGSSFQQEALRFGELGEDALPVDLASYLTQYQFGNVKYLLGHTSYGTSRHLINSFSSRGMTLTLPFSSQFDFSVAAMNGSSVVGFNNFFGLANRRHQLVSGTLGAELLPKRPGGLRVETAVMQGWLQPVSGFNQGIVNDAERSKGIGFRVLASDANQRLRIEGGFSRSEFFNPADAELNQNQDALVEIAPIWKNAQYLDAAYDLFKDFALSQTKKLNLTINFKHERVDPLYRSLGASTQADKLSNEFLVTGSLGEITAQYAHQRFRDNLANVPSILTSNTRVHTLTIAIPMASLFGNPEAPSKLLPRTAYNFNRTFQFGAAIPVNGGFEVDLATIPDQVSTNQGITADWQFTKWRFGYRLNHSFQNNRQIGNELADLRNFTQGFSVGINPHVAVDLNLDVNAESALDKLNRAINRNVTVGPNVTWRITQAMNLVSTVSYNFAGDAAATKNNRNINFDLQYSYQFAREKDRWRKLSGQFSIKYSNTFARTSDLVFTLNDLRKQQTLFVQMSFTFF